MNLFWGCAFILAGLIIITNIIFGINLPVMKIIFAGILIYIGFSMLMPSSFNGYSCFTSYQSHHNSSSHDNDNYSVRFSSSVINLAHLNTINAPRTITIDTQCADVVIVLAKDLPVRVKANVQFASVSLPGHIMSSEYVNLYGALEPRLIIYINSQFSHVIVKE